MFIADKSRLINPNNISAGDARRRDHAQSTGDSEIDGSSHGSAPLDLLPSLSLRKGGYFIELHPLAPVRAIESFVSSLDVRACRETIRRKPLLSLCGP
jgi:hypothetical protein